MQSKESSCRIQPVEFPSPPQCKQAGIKTCAAFSIAAHGRCYGHIVAAFTGDGSNLSSDDICLAELVAVYCGLALEQGQAASDHAQLEAAQREAEGEATQKARLLGALIDSLEDGVIIVDADRRVILANESAATLLGIPRDEISSLDRSSPAPNLHRWTERRLPTTTDPRRGCFEAFVCSEATTC